VARYPAIFVNRITAEKFAESVGGRLPTEAEWEYAARSGGQPYRWAGRDQVAKIHVPNAHLDKPGELWPVIVKSFPGEDETDQKVFDMTGNVREWCLDVYKPYAAIIGKARNTGVPAASQALRDPRTGGEPETDSQVEYVVRGGSFQYDPDAARTFQRDGVAAASEQNDLGFRVVIQCPPDTQDITE
jgi:formylglycine-generating enzyme required for sulfatase activity